MDGARFAPTGPVMFWARPFFEIFPDVQGTRLPDVIEDAFQVGSSSILTHTLNTLLPLQGETAQPCFTISSCAQFVRVRRNYCLLQITDVTVAVTRERVLRERQNARYHAIVEFCSRRYYHNRSANVNIQWVNGVGGPRTGIWPFRIAGKETRHPA